MKNKIHATMRVENGGTTIRFKLSLSLVCLVLFFPCFSQDVIIKRNGDEFKAKVVEIAGTTIKYKKWENIDGPLYNIDQTEVFKVKYENGQSDFFGNVPDSKGPAIPTPQPTQEPVNSNRTNLPKAESHVVVSGYPMPTIANTPYQYDEQRGTLLNLETVNFMSERVHSGLWGKHNIIILPRLFSTVQLHKSQNPKFIIRFDKEVEPITTCLLNTCDVNDKLKRREWIAATTGMHGTEKAHDDVLITFQKIAPLTYLITLDKKLKPGELFFSVGEASEVYAFGYYK